ncbi:MAG TPA: thioester domain-containing protein [Mycobacterium sp.]|uniref:thioester domain-containing protein n=1 Tax=Mycolicibacterium sp. TaxID=2320850 RepID=UPI0025EC5E1F|nr:thioester domain-containing protein [Mycolicibacterium sp.]HPX35528.1 thioester domain-containing protein [Mycobacterium sp.]HQC75464.1 thioester domain-containing protein [Mycobacterium sp.]
MPSLPLLAPVHVPIAVTRRVLQTPVVDLSRMTRYRGGTYSHTVDTIVFTDGTSARTDLIRLNPNIEAYSLDFAGIAPTRPSRYSAQDWSAVPQLQARAYEAEVDWILRNSYPTLSTTVISERLRAAGHPLGLRNITDHEAIAATQAAIWNLTNGLELDNRPLNVPVRTVVADGALTVEFDGERQLAGFTAVVSTREGAALALQKSHDGQSWDDVAASRIQIAAGGGEFSRYLGVGSTVSDSQHGSRGRGHLHYRVLIEGDAVIEDITFHLDGSRAYRNAEPIVHLYNYLLAGARAARESVVAPTLHFDAAVVDVTIVGPFRLDVTDSAAVTATEGYAVIDADGVVIDAPLDAGAEFYLLVPEGSGGVTLTVKVPGRPDGFGGRVITGVARDEDGSYTPLALAVPAQLAIEFELSWGTY